MGLVDDMLSVPLILLIMDCLINIDDNVNRSFDCLNLLVTSKAGQRLIITEDEEGEFNIKIE